jgi:phage-related protein
MIGRMSLEDADGNFYIFPVTFFMNSDPFAVRSSIKDLVYAHGGRQTADKFVSMRRLSISGELSEASADLFETEYRALMKAAMRGGKLRVPTDSVPRYIEVSAPSIDSEWLHFQDYKRIDITFNVEFPFWQDNDETTYTKVVAGDDTLTIDLTGSDHIVMPTIEIDADQGVDVPSVKFTNMDDGGLTLQYDNAAFIIGDVLIMDSSEGTIERNGNSAIEFLVSGAFIRLQPISNVINYEGAACTIKIKYRKVYL